MIERHIIIDNVDPVTFYGVNNSNIQLIRNLFPKLRMAARGSVITVIGDDSETAEFEQKVHALADYCATYNTLPEDVIIDTSKGTPPKQLKMDDVIVYGVNGKPISGRTPNQQLLVKTFMNNDLTFALVPQEQEKPIWLSHWPLGRSRIVKSAKSSCLVPQSKPERNSASCLAT